MIIIMMSEEEFKKEISDACKKWNDEMQSIDRDVFVHAGWFDQINLYGSMEDYYDIHCYQRESYWLSHA